MTAVTLGLDTFGDVLADDDGETVARKIVAALRTLGATRFDLKYGLGGQPRGAVLRSIELYGTRVAPLVRELFE
ncbi:hypothetical protein [Amycolatopsis echigonensis]|uniref:Uncharacterized protein n=1 Tax=Amycolatopsis echigonensis TaxID=2576905 RepID=A0A8E2BAB5_9PSEU|nr:hypothetical protein [Amycolatopsis echigonensis]MBB2506145.1 hypothetical protein [Amycolatopsis echigonensis]